MDKVKISVLREALSKNEIDRTINELLDITRNSRKDLHNEILLISSKHERNMSESRQGVEESSRINIENARVVKSLLEVLDLIETGKRNNATVKNNLRVKNIFHVILKGFSIIMLVMGIFFFYFRIDVIFEAFKGMKNVDYSQLILPVMLMTIGILVLYKTIYK